MKQGSHGHLKPSSPEAAVVISRYRASGLGLKRFAREAGIPAGRLHYWLYQKARAGAGRRCAQDGEPVSAPAFQEVRIADCLPSASDWAVEIGLPNGLVPRFKAGSSPVWISAVVRELQRSC